MFQTKCGRQWFNTDVESDYYKKQKCFKPSAVVSGLIHFGQGARIKTKSLE